MVNKKNIINQSIQHERLFNWSDLHNRWLLRTVMERKRKDVCGMLIIIDMTQENAWLEHEKDVAIRVR